MPGLVMQFGNCINGFVTAVKPAEPRIFIVRWFRKFVPTHKRLRCNAWTPG